MSSDLSVAEFLLKEKPCSVLVEIGRMDEAYGSTLSREVDTTYSHCNRIISDLEDKGLIESEKSGRKNILSLTDEGRRVAEALENLLGTLRAAGENL